MFLHLFFPCIVVTVNETSSTCYPNCPANKTENGINNNNTSNSLSPTNSSNDTNINDDSSSNLAT